MATSFRTPYQVVIRGPGKFTDGVYSGPVDLRTMRIEASVQPLNNAEYDRMQRTPSGTRRSSYRRVFTDSLLAVAEDESHGDSPGDIIIIEGHRYSFIDISPRNVLQSAASHNRYVVRRLIERGPGETGA